MQFFRALLLFSATCFYCANCFAQDSTLTIPLWKNGAPGFENRRNEKELAQDWWVRNIHNPSLTVFFPPKGQANGTAVVVCPGGGFRNIVFNGEGRDAAKFLNGLGITAFVLKYRLFRMENSPYTEIHPEQDIFRAMRVVRNQAKNFSLDTARIGVMGFSAGGEVAAWVSYRAPKSIAAADAIDQLPARPAFQMLIYPGPLAVPDRVPANAPSTFLLAANGDECCSEPLIQLVQLHRKAKVPVEMHLYAQGAHAFNMGYRSTFASLKSWPQRMVDWLNDSGWLKK